MGDGNDDSPLFKGWSTKDLMFVGVTLTGMIAFAMSLDKRVDLALSSEARVARALEQIGTQHKEIMGQLLDINKWVATIQARQDNVITRLGETEERSIECLKGIKR